jgi:ABC-type lipoprotein export system ATPase subunit
MKKTIDEQIISNFTIKDSLEKPIVEIDEILSLITRGDKPNFKIGVIIGTSGSGKTLLLESIKNKLNISNEEPIWSDKSIASHFESYKDAEKHLLSVGLGSIPSWLKPYKVLSNGEKHRADLAMLIKNDKIAIDEFVSYVDNNASLGLSNSLGKYIRDNNKLLIVATLNPDIIEFINPCWVYNTDLKEFTLNKNHYNLLFDTNKGTSIEFMPIMEIE